MLREDDGHDVSEREREREEGRGEEEWKIPDVEVVPRKLVHSREVLYSTKAITCWYLHLHSTGRFSEDLELLLGH